MEALGSAGSGGGVAGVEVADDKDVASASASASACRFAISAGNSAGTMTASRPDGSSVDDSTSIDTEDWTTSPSTSADAGGVASATACSTASTIQTSNEARISKRDRKGTMSSRC